jgi:hypothetical protein
MKRPARLLLAASLSLLALLALPAAALETRERIELAEWLTADDRPTLAESEEVYADVRARMFEVRSELDVLQADLSLVAGPLESATEELEAAEIELREAVQFEAPREEILALEDAVYAAKEWVAEAEADIRPHLAARDEAQQRFDVLEAEHRAARLVWDAALKEVRGTERFIEALDDRPADALYAAMREAALRDALPLDIDLEALRWIVDKQLGGRAIEQLPLAFEEARVDGRDGAVVFLCRIGDPDCPEDRTGAVPVEPALEAVDESVAPEPASVLDLR